MRIFSYIFIFILLPKWVVAQGQQIAALSSPKGVYLRLNADFLASKKIGDAKFIIKRQKLNEESIKTVGQVEMIKTYQEFQELVGIKEASEFDKMKKFTSPSQTMAYFNSHPAYKDVALLGELKIEFLQALGFAFLDKTAQKNELYRYSIYEKTATQPETLVQEIAVFYYPQNPLLKEIKPQLSKITGADSSVTFEWKVDFQTLSDNASEQVRVGSQLEEVFSHIPENASKKADEKSYNQIKVIYINNPKVLSTSPVDDFSTHFLVYYRTNGNVRWRFLEKKIADTDSLGNKRISAKIVGKLDDLVEAMLIPEDYVYNQGDTTKIARGVIAHKGSIELIYGVSAKDSANSIILQWRKLANKPYYAGVEIAKSIGGEPAKVIQVLPATASQFIDTEVYPAGQLFTYYVRPVFIEFQELQQDIGASVAITCAKFSRPTPPFNLKVSSQGQFAQLSWEVADEKAIYSYLIYRGTSPQKMKPIRSAVKTQQYVDSTDYLSARLTYYYSVMAMNVTQDTSAYAPYVSYVPVKKEEVQSPPLLGYEILNNQAVLTWSDVKLNDDFIQGYVIERKKKGENTFKTVHQGIIKGTSYTDESFERGNEYLYRIALVTLRGDTADFSPAVSVSAELAKNEWMGISGIKLMNLAKSIQITWTSIERGDVTGYKVYRKLPTESDFKVLATLPNGNFSYEDKQVKNGVIYVYTVTTLNAQNQESEMIERKSLYREPSK